MHYDCAKQRARNTGLWRRISKLLIESGDDLLFFPSQYSADKLPTLSFFMLALEVTTYQGYK